MNDPSPSRFRLLFESALQDYEEQTGIALAKHPVAEQLENCDSVESVTTFLQDQARSFSEFRESNSRAVNSLKRVVSVLYKLSDNTALGESIGLLFPPAKAISAGLAILFTAVKGVDSGYDSLADLLESIEQFLGRLDIYTKVTPTGAMDEIIVKIMVELLSTLAIVTKQIKQKRAMKLVKRLLGENDVEAVLSRLDRLTQDEARMTAVQTLEVVYGLVQNMRVVMGDGKASIDSVRDALEIIQQIAIDMSKLKRDKLLRDIHCWLSPPDPWKNHSIACESRHAGTAAWFVESDAFSEWKSGPNSLLWIQGKPGAGKSILCSTIIEDLDFGRKSGLASLAFFYFDFREDQKKDRRGLLSSVLVQLCRQSDSYCDVLSDFYLEHSWGTQHPSDGALSRCLKDMLEFPGQPPIYLVLDALDECPNTSTLPSPRRKVLMLLEELVKLQLPNLRICVTSRPEIDIKVVLDPLVLRSVSLHDEMGQMEDIDNYIEWAISTDPRNQRWKSEDKQMVIDFLIERANGMFRWVYCQVVYICGCLPGRIRPALAELPETLDETYQRTLREINEADWELAHRLFQCVAVASRPLLVEELAEFLAFDFKAGPIPKFHEDWRLDDPVDAVLSTCSSLLSIVNVGDFSVIQFSHFSVKEVLTSARLASTSDTISGRYYISMAAAHTLVAQASLGTLLHLDEGVSRSSLQKFPLANYAAQHWIDHARFESVSRNVEAGMKQLFDPNELHLAVWIWICDPSDPFWSPESSEGPSKPSGTPLHYAALCGLDNIVKFLIFEHSQDVHARGFHDKSTPLYQASSGGHVQVARILLGNGADVMSQTERGSTPLHEASFGGHVELVRLLLKHDADITARNKQGWTPLHRASSGGDSEVVRVLLECGADATAQDNNGWTPLHRSSLDGHVEVTRFLLEHGASSHDQDRAGWTPLHLSSSEGQLEVARVLFKFGANATTQDNLGWTPLHRASSRGHVELVRILLQVGADATAQDRDGSTPLHRASSEGHVEVAHVLLECGADAKAQAGDGCTPLDRAWAGGHDGVAHVLLEYGVDVTAQAGDRWTPLHRASYGGQVRLARVLLERGADVAAQDKVGQTPLHRASSMGHVDVVRVLLEYGADATAEDDDKCTPLYRAAFGGRSEVTRVLFDGNAALDKDGYTLLHRASAAGEFIAARTLLDGGADVTVQDKEGQTPLHLASSAGYDEIASILLQCGANVTAQDKDGQTPLHRALVEDMSSFTSWGYHRNVHIVHTLLQRGADVTIQDKNGQAPLHLASSTGHRDVVHALLKCGADVTAQDKEGQTPLHHASSSEVVRILVEHSADVGARDKDGMTPLHHASSQRFQEVAHVLLECGADVTAQDKHRWTPLHHVSQIHVDVARVLIEHGADATAEAEGMYTPLHGASSRGLKKLVRVLLEHGADLTARDECGRTPLQLALQEGHEDVARILRHSADPDDYANIDQIPSEEARAGGYRHIMQLLSFTFFITFIYHFL